MGSEAIHSVWVARHHGVLGDGVCDRPWSTPCHVAQGSFDIPVAQACTAWRQRLMPLTHGVQSCAEQEEEKRYRPGTNKHIAFQALKAAGPKGLTVPQIMAAAKQSGLKAFDDGAKRVIQFVRALLIWPACTLLSCMGNL